MKPAKLVSALQQCAAMLSTHRGIYVLHHAREFGEYVLDFHTLYRPEILSAFVGLPMGIDPVACDPTAAKLPAATIERHLEWMVQQIDRMSADEKCRRWIGFVAGAAERRGHPPSVYWKSLIDSTDLPRLTTVATVPSASKHPVAHFALGYMQGWLWADGQGSIDYFRRMNTPDDESFKSEARAS